MTKKITVNKSDEAAIIVEKIIESDAKEVILSIPRFSHLAESLSNFHLLKREAETLGKKVLIESVDDRVVELAALSGLKAVNPFFTKSKKQFSDIVAPRAKQKSEESQKAHFIPSRFAVESLEEKPPAPRQRLGMKLFSLSKFWLPSLSVFRRVSWQWVLAVVIITAVSWVLLKELPRADINLVVQKSEWSYNDSILADKSAKVDPQSLTVPSQIFTQKKNAEMRFPATGKKQVERKAIGKMVVYNSYSSEAQPLVANTRFISPDGKLFRLVKGIVVPGAKIIEGQIVPSNIETDVVADQAGPEYNIEPVKLFTIPGFKGSPKYQAFYGESKESMAGGFIGEVAYPTPDDIKSAKARVAQALGDDLKATIFSQMPEGFKILNEATSFSTVSQTVKEEVDGENNFSIFSEAKMTVIGFKDSDVLDILRLRAQEERGMEFKIQASDLKYGLGRADFQSGKMSFLVEFRASLWHRVDIESLKNRSAGRPENDLKAIIFALPGVESATVSLWPFWVGKVPVDLGKIRITVD
ncbi:MAG: hypothetical protein Q8P76_01110 [bacterium]|nr:hypothetical protein [bacterium]